MTPPILTLICSMILNMIDPALLGSCNFLDITNWVGIFNSFINQQSIVDLNLSSFECSNRNRLTSVGVDNITEFLSINNFIETLSLSGNSIRNEGLKSLTSIINSGSAPLTGEEWSRFSGKVWGNFRKIIKNGWDNWNYFHKSF